MKDSKPTKSQLLFIIQLPLFFGLLYFFVFKQSAFQPQNKVEVIQNPSIIQGTLGREKSVHDYTFIKLPNDLDKAEIHDLLFHEKSMWLGTDKGLVKIKNQKVTIYKQFSDWPFEWVNNLVIVPQGIVVNTYVALGSTGGESAGTYFFHFKKETWQKIGRNVLAQTWLNGYLYQATSKLVRRSPSTSWREEEVLSGICRRRPTSLRMDAINDEVWLTGDGTGLSFNMDDSFGCGVLRYSPKKKRSIVYKTEDGLNHNKGWDLGGDEKDVYVTHSVKHNRMSHFNFEKNQWESMKVSGSGNSITVTANNVWIAQGSPRRPFNRINRKTFKYASLPAFSDNEYISVISIDGKKVWFGTYIKSWQDSKYSINSRFGFYINQ